MGGATATVNCHTWLLNMPTAFCQIMIDQICYTYLMYPVAASAHVQHSVGTGQLLE